MMFACLFRRQFIQKGPGCMLNPFTTSAVRLIRVRVFSSLSEQSSPSLTKIKTTIQEIDQILRKHGMKRDQNLSLATKILGLKILDRMSLEKIEERILSLQAILPLSAEELFVFLRKHPIVLYQSKEEFEAKINHFKKDWCINDVQMKKLLLQKHSSKFLDLTTSELQEVNKYYKENFKLRYDSVISNSLFSVGFWERYVQETSKHRTITDSAPETPSPPPPPQKPLKRRRRTANSTTALATDKEDLKVEKENLTAVLTTVKIEKEKMKRIRDFFRLGYNIRIFSPSTERILLARVFELNSEEDLHKKLKALTLSLDLSSNDLRLIVSRVPVLLNESVEDIEKTIKLFKEEINMSTEEIKRFYLKGTLYVVSMPLEQLRNHIKRLKEDFELTEETLKKSLTDAHLIKNFEFF